MIFFFIGRGIDYAISMEGSLKMKEISYIHSEAHCSRGAEARNNQPCRGWYSGDRCDDPEGSFEKTLSNI